MPFSALQDQEFVGRRQELLDLYRRALDVEKGRTQSIFLSGSRGTGKTELLKQLFTYLFWKQDAVVPFYYAVNGALLSVPGFSRDYITRFICQRLAFEHKEQALLYLEGLTIPELTKRAQDRGAPWAAEILDRYLRALAEPADALRMALSAPLLSAFTTGKPVVVMIDEFHRLAGLHTNGSADPHLISLFEVSLSSRRTPHIITGNGAEIQEMPLPSLARVPIRPLTPEESARLFLAVLQGRGVAAEAAPPALLDRLGGNPFYLHAAAAAVEPAEDLRDQDFWMAYLREIEAGSIANYWSSILKRVFASLAQREQALEVIRKIYETGGSFAELQTAGEGAASDQSSERIAHALYRSGLVHGEFGVFRPPEDEVLRDVVDCLYLKEILGKSPHEIQRVFQDRWSGAQRDTLSFELVLPRMRDAELVAAQCIEQIGKNRRVNEEIIGQMQMAVIEACINAIEHGRGDEDKIYVGIRVDADRIEVSIESPGREFIPLETGEPFVGRALAEEAQRGWGVKLMKRFTDSVRFERTGRGTRVVLLKNLQRPVEIPKEGTHDRE